MRYKKNSMTGSHAIIAVLGDLHGHLTLAYRLLRRWEVEHGERVNLILQVGDLGCFPDPTRLDKATRRFAEKDPDELDFWRHYVTGSPEADEILVPESQSPFRIDADLWFIKGNHEDFEFLEGVGAGPVDHYWRIHYLPNGGCYDVTLENTDEALWIGVLGGIPGSGGPGSDPATEHYTRSEVRALGGRTSGVDLFLTHASSFGSVVDDQGSHEVRELIQMLRPRYHFCGHHHSTGRELDAPEPTRSFLLNEVNFKTRDALRDGCIGILRWRNRETHEFELIDEPWLGEFTRQNYRNLQLPGT